MVVLSLFDGISCGQLALQKAGINVDAYIASEIDKPAIKVAMKNFPETIQVGSVSELKSEDLPKIDLLIGGSPCQGFSVAGKGLNFDDPRSKLFFEYVRLLKELREVNPNIKFLLENVKMKQEWQDIISEYLGVQPIKINSALLTAQNRVRLYWTNIDGVTQPNDLGIYLKDILEQDVAEKYFLSEETVLKLKYIKGSKVVDREKNGFKYQFKEGQVPFPNSIEGKAQCLVAQGQSTQKDNLLLHEVCVVGNVYPKGGQNGNVYSIEGKSRTLLAGEGNVGSGIGSSNSPKILVPCKFNRKDGVGVELVKALPILASDFRGLNRNQTQNCVCEQIGTYERIRRLTPVECARLQTVPDDYFNDTVSDTQIYKQLGNGWTVDVIAHILSNLKTAA